MIGSAGPPIIAISPNPATVGDLVTFTINHNFRSCYEVDSDADQSLLFPKGKTEGSLATRTSGSMSVTAYPSDLNILNAPSVWTYTYTESGTFNVDFDCADRLITGMIKGDDRENLTKRLQPASAVALIVNQHLLQLFLPLANGD